MQIVLPPLHKNQLAVAKSAARFKILVCGRRWGKTRLGATLALQTALSGGHVFWVAPTYSVTGIAWRLLRALVSPLNVIISESTRTITFQSGGWISCRSGDRPDLLRGESLDLAILDEADFIPDGERLWTEVLRPALADRKGKAVMISTPNVENGWFHTLFREGQDSKNKAVKSWQFSSYTNPHLDPKELDVLRGQISEIAFRREILAEFVSAAGALIKPEWIKLSDPPEVHGPVYMAVDLAISEKNNADYTAIVCLTKTHDGRIFILSAVRTRAPFNSILEFIKGQASIWNPELIGIEAVQYQQAVVQELLRTTSLPVIGLKPDKDKVSRFTPLQARFEQGLVYINPSINSYYIQELQGFPVGAHDDMVDATAYAYQLGSRPTIAMS